MTGVTVWFVDTSVLCNVLPVPGRDQHRHAVVEQMREKEHSGGAFILPLTAVIETGNHISQLSAGRERRATATKFRDLLELVIRDRTPWRLHTFRWDDDFLGLLIKGAETGVPFVEHAMSGVGCGDLCVLTERAIYRTRTGISDVRVWTLDAGLSAYS